MTEKTKGKSKMAIETLAFNENTQERLMIKSKKDKNNECFDVQKGSHCLLYVDGEG